MATLITESGVILTTESGVHLVTDYSTAVVPHITYVVSISIGPIYIGAAPCGPVKVTALPIPQVYGGR